MSSRPVEFSWQDLFHYPASGPTLNFWIVVMMTAYLMVIGAARGMRHEPIADMEFLWEAVSNGFNVATSICLIWGFVDHRIIEYLGDLSSFLVIYGFVGIGYGIGAIIQQK